MTIPSAELDSWTLASQREPEENYKKKAERCAQKLNPNFGENSSQIEASHGESGRTMRYATRQTSRNGTPKIVTSYVSAGGFAEGGHGDAASVTFRTVHAPD